MKTPGIVSKFVWLSITLALLGGCAGRLTPAEVASHRTIAIANGYPEFPSYIVVGTTLFNNEYDEVREPDYRSYVTEELAEQLRAKGYEVSVIDPEQIVAHDGLTIEVVPRDIYGFPETFGFGFHKRTFLGATIGKLSYAAMNLVPRVDGSERCIGCFGSSVTSLDIDMPATWAELGDADRQKLDRALRDDIRKAIEVALKSTRL